MKNEYISREQVYKNRFKGWTTEYSTNRFNDFDSEISFLTETNQLESFTNFKPRANKGWQGKEGWEMKKKNLKEGWKPFINHIGEPDEYYDDMEDESIKEPEDYIYSGKYSKEDYEGEYRFFITKNDFSTKEGIEKAERDLDYGVNNLYKLKKECDLSHDRSAYYASEAVLKLLDQKIAQATKDLNLTKEDFNKDYDLMYFRLKDIEDQKVKAERKAIKAQSKKDNQVDRLANYAEQALEVETPELKDLLDDLGFLKERKSWGVIKNYLGTEDGKVFKNLWINQFK